MQPTTSGPIILVDDDPEDKELMEDVLRELGFDNPIEWFTDSDKAFEYLTETSEQPFVILCDISLPGVSGIEFKKRLDADHKLRLKSIPFVLLSTSTNRDIITKAYTEMTIQGVFRKAHSYTETKAMMRTIMDYWNSCLHPNSKDAE